MSGYRRLPSVVAVLIGLLTLVLYLPVLRNGFVSWDDDIYVVQNLSIRSLNWNFLRWALFDYKTNLWHPLTWVSHALDYAFWGLDPFGHHLTSVVLHAVNAGLVVLLTVMLLRTANEWNGRTGGWILDERALSIAGGVTGVFFGVHPLHVESVAWIAERKDLLYALFFMLSIMSYVRFARGTAAASARVFLKNKHYRYSLLWFFLAACSKPMAVTLPLVLLLLDWYPLNRVSTREERAAVLREKIPFVTLSVFLSMITLSAQKGASGLIMMQNTPLTTRLLVACKAYVHYLWKLAAPLHLAPFYPYPKEVALPTMEYLSAVLLLLAITAFCLFRLRKQPFWLATWSFFVITLLPVIGIAQVGRQYAADRFEYLSTLGFLMLLGSGAALLWEKAESFRNKKMTMRLLLAGCMMAAVISLSYATLKQIPVWKNELSLWNSVIEAFPHDDPWAYMFRGVAFQNDGNMTAAVSDFSTAIAQNPDHVEAYVNRGSALCNLGQFDRALDDFTKAITLRPAEYMAYNDRGNAFYRKGDLGSAAADFDTAIQLHPERPLAYNNRGAVRAAQGKIDGAMKDFTKAILLSPTYADAYYNRGSLSAKQGKFAAAISDLGRVIALQPRWSQAYLDRGDYFLTGGNAALAKQDYQTACLMGDERGCKKEDMPRR